MRPSVLFPCLLMIVILFSCKQETKPAKLPVADRDTCAGLNDTRVILPFQKDTSTIDFFKMIDFLLKKGELELGKGKTKLESFTDTSVLLQKILCPDENFDPPIEHVVLRGVFSVTCWLELKKQFVGKKDLYGGLWIRQLNFANEAEKQKALENIQEIGWGDPQKKWNDYMIAFGKKRIYIISTSMAASESLKRKYAFIIQDEWAGKK